MLACSIQEGEEYTCIASYFLGYTERVSSSGCDEQTEVAVRQTIGKIVRQEIRFSRRPQ